LALRLNAQETRHKETVKMETTYRRFGKVRRLPATIQVKHELRHGFYPDFQPLAPEIATRAAGKEVGAKPGPSCASASQPAHLAHWESEGGAVHRPGDAPAAAPQLAAKRPGAH
jgi:hypothetical protein